MMMMKRTNRNIAMQLLFLMTVTLTVTGLNVDVLVITRPLVIPTKMFDIHVPQIRQAGVVVCPEETHCRIYELVSGEVKIVHTRLGNWAFNNALSERVTVDVLYENATEFSGNLHLLWSSLSSKSQQFPKIFSLLNRNSFAFSEEIMSLFCTNPNESYSFPYEDRFHINKSPAEFGLDGQWLRNLDRFGTKFAEYNTNLYFRRDVRDKKGELYIHVGPDVDLSDILKKLVLKLFPLQVGDVDLWLDDFWKTQGFVPKFAPSLRELSENEKMMQRLDYAIESLFGTIQAVRLPFLHLTKNTLPSDSDIVALIIYSALSEVAWQDIYYETMLIAVFNNPVYNVFQIDIGNTRELFNASSESSISSEAFRFVHSKNCRIIAITKSFDPYRLSLLLVPLPFTFFGYYYGLYYHCVSELLVPLFPYGSNKNLIATVLCTCLLAWLVSKYDRAQQWIDELGPLILYITLFACCCFIIILHGRSKKQEQRLNDSIFILKELNSIVPGQPDCDNVEYGQLVAICEYLFQIFTNCGKLCRRDALQQNQCF